MPLADLASTLNKIVGGGAGDSATLSDLLLDRLGIFVTATNGVVDRDVIGSTDGRQNAVSANTGYDWHWRGLSVGPIVGFNYVRVDIDGFAESGAEGLDLSFAAWRIFHSQSRRARFIRAQYAFRRFPTACAGIQRARIRFDRPIRYRPLPGRRRFGIRNPDG